MSAAKKIKDLLSASPNQYIPSIEKFLPLDLERIKSDLGLQISAQQNGERDIPASDSSGYDDIESKIVNLIETERTRTLNEFNQSLTTYNERLASLSIEARLSEVKVAAAFAVSEFKSDVHQAKDDLTLAQEAVSEQDKYLISFRQANGLTRPADYPNSWILHVGIILLAFLIEAFANATFLAQGSEFGLFGGFMEAIIFAAINIGVAWLVGRKVIPMLVHKSVFKKVIGGVLFLAWLPALCLFNVALAHYRDALGGDNPEQAAKLVIQTLATNPFAISDFKSGIMIGMGCLLGIVALMDGFKMDDPYPKYGHLHKKRAQAFTRYANLKHDLLEKFKDTRDEAVDGLTELKRDLVKKREEHDRIIANRRNLLATFEAHQNYLESCGQTLLNFYRTQNMTYRKSAAPARFKTQWKIERRISPVIPNPLLSDEQLIGLMQEVNAMTTKSIEEVMTEFLAAQAMCERLSDLIQGAAK